MQNYQWNVRLTSNSEGKAIAHLGKTQFEIKQALQFDQTQESISALEYVLGAIGGDIVSGFSQLAQKKRIQIDNVEASIQGELNNPLVHLGVVGEEGDPGLKRIQMRVFISTTAPEEEVKEVWSLALKRSPLATTFSQLIQFDLSFKVVF